MSQLTSSRPIIFGEVLFDVFTEGAVLLGGAPFNVAWNLKGFGLDPVFISSVGDDDLGAAVLKAMRDWGMDTGAVQVDHDHPTGTVDVSVENGQPSYSILDGQAYDYINEDMASRSLTNGKFSVFYHGSLIARSETSRATLYSLRESLNLPLFVDVNLRTPWWDVNGVINAIKKARWVKLNSDELCDLLEEELDGKESFEEAAERMRRKHGIETIILTIGEDGAMILSSGGVVSRPVDPVSEVRDTVGAGDAFSAVSILGFVAGWTPEETIGRATTFASEICQIQGAVSFDKGLYEKYSLAWGL